jgi:hypothetical protein
MRQKLSLVAQVLGALLLIGGVAILAPLGVTLVLAGGMLLGLGVAIEAGRV